MTVRDTSAERNPTWQRDELILALDLYFRHHPSGIGKNHPEIIKLSEALNTLPVHPHKPDAIRFRNPNGVYMKLCNFLRHDPEYAGVGLSRGSSQEKVIWDEFAQDRERLSKVASAIVSNVEFSATRFDEMPEEDEEEFPEGRVLYRLHRTFERNRSLIKSVKRRAEIAGLLRCSACGFDFFERYGDVGRGFIECHHTLPISEYEPGQKTQAKDLALVCSNCHRMLHRRRPWLRIDELAELTPQNDKPEIPLESGV